MCAAVLVGVDGSDEARKAAAVAGRLAGRLGLQPVVEREVEPDDAAAGLLRAARDEGAALLALGSRGRGAVRAALLGSVSRQVLSEARLPVLVVGPEVSADWPELEIPEGKPRIVCGVDQPGEDAEVVQAAARVARGLGGELVLVAVVAPPLSTPAVPGPVVSGTSVPPDPALLETNERAARQLLDRAAGLAPSLGMSVKSRTETGDPPVALEAAADAEGAVLNVVGCQRHGAVERGLLGSVAAALPGRSRRPVLAVPAGASLRLPAAA